jgi:hypothetical protein
MGHTDTTYIIFDGDKDYWAYARMKGWNALKNIDFDFRDAHKLKEIRDWSQPDTVKRTLRERFSTAEQAIVLIGEETRSHHRFVRWEMEVALGLDLPVIAVNLNGLREMDEDLCPPILRREYVVHIPFKLKIIKHALDSFPSQYHRRDPDEKGPLSYPDSVYWQLGLVEHPEKTIRKADGQVIPADGYRWVNPRDPNDFLVELVPGLLKLENGGFRPANGYRWVNANDQNDLRVVPS